MTETVEQAREDQARMAAAEAAIARRRLPKWITLSTAGFALSVTLALINAYYVVRGSEVVVQPAEQVILFRDGEGDKAVLTLAIRLAMINAADASHGDVLMTAHASVAGQRAEFAYSTEIKPVFSTQVPDAKDCAFGSRCIALPGLLAIEQGDQILDIPGGSVRSPYLSFPLTSWNCEGKDCAAFPNFAGSAQRLAKGPLDITIKLAFFGDGHRWMRCLAKPVDLKYLNDKGWMSMRCRTATVRSDQWL